MSGAALVVSAVTHAPLRGQERVHVTRFTVDDGLAENNVSAIVQDSTGYVWVGTKRGLQRFDGYTFVPIAALDARAATELRGPIDQLLVDRRGRFWVMTPFAAFWGRPGTAPLTRMSFASTVAPDSSGRLWLVAGQGQLGWIDWHSAAPKITTMRSDTLPPCCTVMATTRAQKALWVAPATGRAGEVIRIDLKTGKNFSYRLQGMSTVSAIAEDTDGRIWVGGHGGLQVLDADTDEFRTLAAFREREVGDIKANGSGGLLIATDRWLARVDRQGTVLERWAPREIYGEAPVHARDIMIDREDGWWLATLATGVLRFDRTATVFEHVSSASTPSIQPASDFVMALHEARDGTLWTGTLGGGAFRLSDVWTELERLPHAPGTPDGLPSGNVWDFEEDRAGNLWVGTSNGLCVASPKPVRCYAPAAADASVADVTRAADDWLWLARGHHGVDSFDPRTRQFGAHSTLNWTIAVHADTATNELWIGGSQLYRVRVSNGRFMGQPREVPADVSVGETIYDIRRDSRGILWLASHRGLQRWDSTQQRFAAVNVPELLGTTVFSLAEDAQGRLWLGTGHGLVQYSPVTGAARRYRRQDGVMSGEFNRRAALRRRSGEMVFGGIQGLTVFQPERVNAPRVGVPLVFTRWQKVTADGPVDSHVLSNTATKLVPGDRAFTIEFAALTFAAGPARRYRYRLEGLNHDWIETNDHAATYATPPPGHYVFRVQAAAASDGAWAEPGTALALQVVPPVWATTWFRALIVLLFLCGLWLLHRMRLRQAVATERLRLRISRDLHDEIGAGLSSIALMSDAAGMMSTGEGKQLERISRSARGMVADLRDIVWAIDPDGDRLKDVVARMQDVATDLLSDVRVNFRAPPAHELSGKIGMAARRDLLLIYKEVLHNVARHARAGAVDILLASRGDDVELTISDDGIGFDPGGVRAGTGLKSMRERASRLGGRLELSSRETGGTTVRLTVRKT